MLLLNEIEVIDLAIRLNKIKLALVRLSDASRDGYCEYNELLQNIDYILENIIYIDMGDDDEIMAKGA